MSPQATPAHGTASPASPNHDPHSGVGVSALDNLVDELLAGVSHNSPRGKRQIDIWSRAKQADSELRVTLAHRGCPPPEASSSTDSPGAVQHLGSASTVAAAAAFLPGEWWQSLSTETLAALVVDSFTGAFVESFLDGLVNTLEEDEGWVLAVSERAGAAQQPLRLLSPSASAPGALQQLSAPATIRSPQRPHDFLPAIADRAAAGLSRGGGAGGGGDLTRGFTQSGLPKESLQAWNMRRYHACKPLASYSRRIELAAEAQRPRRRTACDAAGAAHDHRKFNWPMMATNFPSAWEDRTQKKRPPGARVEPPKENKSLMTVDAEGRTTFPYSVALHKAFLESQRDPALKAQAYALAPLRLTQSLYP